MRGRGRWAGCYDWVGGGVSCVCGVDVAELGIEGGAEGLVYVTMGAVQSLLSVLFTFCIGEGTMS